ncbi:hypothetical protein IOK49_04995 [Fervidicoccus fontis]|uniref:Uncharacterized protein n=2 Tax=Fervidicoccus fontis TaxID=683846 RepID=I0A211_FERFK|nr:HAD family acid phosphatase [Fervidicoccus fontis]AFH43018.1 hypothetical protein FFONT_1030 [Fervidicoccus fontis Kam940]MBE9391428.1 hypothetical protein [Fervidicoccus fontis]
MSQLDCCIIFDIDGVIIDNTERIEKYGLNENKEDFYSDRLMAFDKPRELGIKLLEEKKKVGKIVIVTGRPERVRKKTTQELSSFGVELKEIKIIFRPNNIDKIEEWKVKKILELRDSGCNICEVHEDSEEVIYMLKYKIKGTKFFLHKGNKVESI